MDAEGCRLASLLVSRSYVDQGAAALAARRKQVKALLSNRRLPQQGWDDATIEMLLQDASLMDSNTFPGQVGLGEREGRVACPLVAAAHGRLAHGIGRSGDITAEQPKAAGSSLLAKLAAALAADALRLAGLADLGPAVVLPSATGMALTLVLLAATAAPAAVRAPAPQSAPPQPAAGHAPAQQEQQLSGAVAAAVAAAEAQQLPRFVVWSRIDQKTCLKAITAANLVPVVVELLRQGDELVTDVAGIRAALEQLGPDRVAAVVTTTSCFAPRACDDVVAVAKLCQALAVPHVINNAYGVQSAALAAAVTAAGRRGRVDALVQSTDKNFMVPVGGAIVAAPAGRDRAAGFDRGWLVDAVATGYPGRASMTAHWDLLVTLLHWGSAGWREKLQGRERLFVFLRDRLAATAEQLGERLLETPRNPISLAMTLDGLAAAAAAHNAAASSAAAGGDAAAAGVADQQTGGAAASALEEAEEEEEEEAAAEAAAVAAEDPDREAAAAAAASGRGGSGSSGGRAKKAAAPAGRADVTFFGSMLWARNVSGTRVLAGGKQQTLCGLVFQDYGCHAAGYPHPYLNAAAAIGGTEAEVDVFLARLVKSYRELLGKWAAA